MTEIKQNNEGDFVNSVISPNHFDSQIVIKQEESSTSPAEEHGVHLNNMTSLSCQVKTEPQSEEVDGFQLQSTVGDYPGGFIMKREIIEVHTDYPMMEDDENHNKTITDEDSGTETNSITKSESDNWSPNFPDDNIDKQNNIFDPIKKNKQQISLTHVKAICLTKKNHKCSVCAKAFQSSQACLQHKWNKHTEENSYTCEVCGKSFKYISQLQLHKAVHSDERPYSCDLCKKTFKLKEGLSSHATSVHSNERLYACDMCNKAFKSKSGLWNHKISWHSDEKPYSCDVCKKTFKQKGHLNRHRSTVHSDEKPYSCDLCDKAFKDKRDLQNHKMRVHADEKPYVKISFE